MQTRSIQRHATRSSYLALVGQRVKMAPSIKLAIVSKTSELPSFQESPLFFLHILYTLVKTAISRVYYSTAQLELHFSTSGRFYNHLCKFTHDETWHLAWHLHVSLHNMCNSHGMTLSRGSITRTITNMTSHNIVSLLSAYQLITSYFQLPKRSLIQLLQHQHYNNYNLHALFSTVSIIKSS